MTYRAAAALAFAAGLTTTVAADHYGYWANNGDFYVRVGGMTDFDQVRVSGGNFFGLPGDGGMYCVPTANSNLMAYIEQHGYGTTSPFGVFVDGPADGAGMHVSSWSSNSLDLYNAAGGYIFVMGLTMGTDPDDGTSNTNNLIENSVRNRLNDLFFDVNYMGRTNTWAPKTIDIANVIRQGGIASFCYGRYEVAAAAFLVERTGGHCVTMTKVDKRASFGYDANEHVINYADPWTSDSDFSQASFFYREEETRTMPYVTTNFQLREMSRIMFDINDPDDTRHRIIDSVVAVFPKAGFTTSNAGSVFQIGNLGLVGGGASPTTPGFTSIDWNGPGAVLDAELDPLRRFIAVVSQTDDGRQILSSVDLAEGVTTDLHTFVGPATGMVIGSSMDAYVAERSGLRCIEIDNDIPDDGRRMEVFTGWPTGFIPEAVASDDDAQRVMVVSSNRVLSFDEFDIQAAPMTQTFVSPISTPIKSAAKMQGTGDLAVLLADGSVQTYTPALSAPQRLSSSRSWSPPAGAVVESMSPGRGGALYVLVNGVVRELVPNATGGFDDVTGQNSPLAGLSGEKFFKMSRGRTNFQAELHSGPAWNNVLPQDLATEVIGAEVEDCAADLVAPWEVLDVEDVTQMILQVEEGVGGGDIAEPIGAPDFFDMLGYLRDYDAGCNTR